MKEIRAVLMLRLRAYHELIGLWVGKGQRARLFADAVWHATWREQCDTFYAQSSALRLSSLARVLWSLCIRAGFARNMFSHSVW